MTLEEIRRGVLDARPGLWQAARLYGRDPKIYLHWTAGDYETTFPDYNLCIKGDGSVVESLPLWQIPSATWKRNSGSISVALCCAKGAVPSSLGDFPPTEAQIECVAQVISVITGAAGIPIDVSHVMTHGEAANNEDGIYCHEPYAVWSDPQPEDGDTRWDLAILADGDEWRSGGGTLRGKAKYYRKAAT